MTFDVVVSGGGPNGLMVACELALAGVRPVVLERLTSPSPEQRANGMVGQVVRLFQRRGLLERLTGDPRPPVPVPQFMFAAFPLPLRELADNPVYTVMVPQRKIEATLAARAEELGVEIRRGHELTGITQKDDLVVVEVAGPDGNYELEARYLVGADGGKSPVRKMAGIGFPGYTGDEDTVSRSAHVTVPADLRDPVTGGLRVPGYGVIPPFLHHRTERGLVAYAPFPDGRTMLSVTTLDRPEGSAPFSIAELQEAFTHVVGVEVPLGPPAGDGPHMLRRLSGGQTRVADRYRAGRVFLVGDAAHVHSAIGGPGLNLGLQDSVNLAWKLAATVHGWAPDGLLDTYEAERRPAGERVTMHTQAQHVLVGPGPKVTALRTLFGELLREPAVLQHVADLIAGADITYGPSPASPLTGRFVPDLGEATRSGRPLLVDNTGTLAPVAGPWSDRVDVVTAPVDGATALLVRPDCYVAWATAEAAPDAAGLRSALTQWFGEPRG
ncbi:FAD-dependent monooxygenase [Paractinoplanes globisporus]|uniref:FAD-dependent monooxygenase n=1 Tax=Paractinoplanes globisporus TaxID=113565 RepID=A0ABW6W6Z3_9ACTN|nr:FAD-dependent monooxygenase [Actinoplanes globisporus]